MTKTKKCNKAFRDDYKPYGTYKGTQRGNPTEWRDTFAEAFDYATCKTRLKDESPWEVLGVAVGAKWADIKHAYFALILKWHPDVNKSPEAHEKCIKIIDAYTVLERTQAP